MKFPKIILASKSPRRAQLLDLAELSYQVIASESDEVYPSGLTPAEITAHVAKQKGLEVQRKLLDIANPGTLNLPIVSADTLVVLEDRVIGKPANTQEAIAILKSLSGKTHLVVTGTCILYKNLEIIFCETTEVDFHILTNEQITFYVDTYHPLDKAGAYAIQEWIGVTGIKAIRGDYYNVMGLPVSRLLQELHALI